MGAPAQFLGGQFGKPAFDQIQFPMLVTITRPLDEYSLKIQITKLTLNGTFENDQFQLEIPAGVPIQKME